MDQLTDRERAFVESRFEKRLLHCPQCDQPFAKRKGNEVWLLRYSRGKPVYTKIEINHQSGNGYFRITCEDCGGGHIFASVTERLGITEKIDMHKD